MLATKKKIICILLLLLVIAAVFALYRTVGEPKVVPKLGRIFLRERTWFWQLSPRLFERFYHRTVDSVILQRVD